ncbi:hypothetical protein [Nguyenibacter vanlangensis]|uniref:Uncharacterized protein n=1 Tax=Nguyenibacter vanlangensis TaxID=1216886 RepID=A0A7Y7IZJ3_9PROT|nr:hypothetical protein [Nguyenibacter vanlangensis]NVN13219.1 hypothetical protein [Nguyenibacter vanlangensis]
MPAGPQDTRGSEPADRLEQALNRIAFALDRRRDDAAQAAPDPHAPDLQTLAANIDILIARIRDVLGPEDDRDKDASDAGRDSEAS